MSRHEDQPRLRHMLDHPIEAVDMSRARTRMVRLSFDGRYIRGLDKAG